MGFHDRVCAVMRNLPDFDQNYIDTAFHNHYVDYGAPPETLSDIYDGSSNDITYCFKLLRDVLTEAAKHGYASEFWNITGEHGYCQRYFLGLVYMGVSQATSSEKISDKGIGLVCCQVYLALIAVPKQGVNLVYPALLQSCLSLLVLPQNNVASASGVSERRSRRSGSVDSRATSEDEEEYPIEILRSYIQHVRETLGDLEVFLNSSVALEEHKDVVAFLAQRMAILTQTGSENGVAEQAYNVLSALCQTQHGDVSEIVRLISYHLNGNMLMLRAASREQVPRPLVRARDASIDFLVRMRHERLDSDDQLVLTAQQLAMRSLEKADIRMRTAQGVVKILLELQRNEEGGKDPSESSLNRIIYWFHKLMRSTFAKNRLFCLELFGQLCTLREIPSALERHLSSITLAALLRVTDELSTVKTKAFTFFAQLTSTPRWMEKLVTHDCTREDIIGALLGILNECVNDSKVFVRRSALNVLNGILCGAEEDTASLDKGPYIDVIVRCCRDQTILVRKQALECLSQVYRRHPAYFKEFVSGVFPLTMDNELSVQEKALSCVLDVVFNSLLSRAAEDLAWNVLNHLGNYERYLPLICEQLCKKDARVQLGRSHVTALVKALNGSNASAAWRLLSHLCNHTEVSVSMCNVRSCQLDDEAECCRLSVLVAQTRSNRDEAFIDSLLSMLDSKSTSFMQFPHVCSILHKLEPGHLRTWAMAAYPECLRIMQSYGVPLSQGSGRRRESTSSQVAGEDLLWAILKTGECVMIVPQLTSVDLCNVVCKLVDNADLCLPSRRLGLRLLGQISLVSEDLAKRLLATIYDTVDHADDLSLRVIGIRIVADLSSRYTLAEPLLPVIYCLLKDSEVDVRRAAIINLLQLLKEDYIKLKNNLLYHLFECLLDDDEMLRDLSEFGLDQFVLKRNPRLFLQNFIDCVFHLNAYRGHSLYNQALQSRRELETFSLAGQPARRHRIYRFIVRRLTEEHKFLLTLNITNNVFKAIVDNETDVDRECPSIVTDLLEVLSMDELRLRVSSRAEDEDDCVPLGNEEQSAVSGVATSVNARQSRKKEQFILNAIKLKTMIESLLPVLTSLKSRCEGNEEVMTSLMTYLNVLSQEYKNELKTLLGRDNASEFYNDIKKFEASRSRLDETSTPNVESNEDTQQKVKMRLIMKVLESARKQQRAILDGDAQPMILVSEPEQAARGDADYVEPQTPHVSDTATASANNAISPPQTPRHPANGGHTSRRLISDDQALPSSQPENQVETDEIVEAAPSGETLSPGDQISKTIISESVADPGSNRQDGESSDGPSSLSESDGHELPDDLVDDIEALEKECQQRRKVGGKRLSRNGRTGFRDAPDRAAQTDTAAKLRERQEDTVQQQHQKQLQLQEQQSQEKCESADRGDPVIANLSGIGPLLTHEGAVEHLRREETAESGILSENNFESQQLGSTAKILQSETDVVAPNASNSVSSESHLQKRKDAEHQDVNGRRMKSKRQRIASALSEKDESSSDRGLDRDSITPKEVLPVSYQGPCKITDVLLPCNAVSDQAEPLGLQSLPKSASRASVSSPVPNAPTSHLVGSGSRRFVSRAVGRVLSGRLAKDKSLSRGSMSAKPNISETNLKLITSVSTRRNTRSLKKGLVLSESKSSSKSNENHDAKDVGVPLAKSGVSPRQIATTGIDVRKFYASRSRSLPAFSIDQPNNRIEASSSKKSSRSVTRHFVVSKDSQTRMSKSAGRAVALGRSSSENSSMAFRRSSRSPSCDSRRTPFTRSELSRAFYRAFAKVSSSVRASRTRSRRVINTSLNSGESRRSNMKPVLHTSSERSRPVNNSSFRDLHSSSKIGRPARLNSRGSSHSTSASREISRLSRRTTRSSTRTLSRNSSLSMDACSNRSFASASTLFRTKRALRAASSQSERESLCKESSLASSALDQRRSLKSCAQTRSPTVQRRLAKQSSGASSSCITALPSVAFPELKTAPQAAVPLTAHLADECSAVNLSSGGRTKRSRSIEASANLSNCGALPQSTGGSVKAASPAPQDEELIPRAKRRAPPSSPIAAAIALELQRLYQRADIPPCYVLLQRDKAIEACESARVKTGQSSFRIEKRPRQP